jgi:hypothetical protein
MWKLLTSAVFEGDQKHYEKKHPRELQAVRANLVRNVQRLTESPNSKAVKAGYLHDEPAGVVAIDQKAGGSGLQETRLYTFADDKTRTLWLITIGNKAEQPKDIQFCRRFVDSLREDDPATPQS